MLGGFGLGESYKERETLISTILVSMHLLEHGIASLAYYMNISHTTQYQRQSCHMINRGSSADWEPPVPMPYQLPSTIHVCCV